MKGMNAVRIGLAAFWIAGACLVGAPSTQAQGGFGGGQMPPDMMAKIKAWQKWRDAHKGLSNLQTMMFQVRQMDKDPSTQLTKPQANKMLGIMRAWRGKPTMSDDQAKQVAKQIGSMLTDKQLKKMSTFQMGRMGGGGGRPGGGMGGGGGRPGGGMGGAGGGQFKMPDPPAGGYNPLNPDTLPFAQMRPRIKKSMDEFTADLEKRK